MKMDQVETKTYKDILRQIIRIRMIEEAIADEYPNGEMRCPTHLSIGQEAVPAMISANLTEKDLAVSTHRAHAHYLAKGGDLNALIAEFYGKATGCTQGRGGSMNLSDLNAGFIASTAIVANTVPIGTGLAFSQHLKKSDAITCIYLGDAAAEEGAVYESLNFAILKKLPALFICENNFYSVNTPIKLRQPEGREIHQIAKGMGAKTMKLDGNDVIASHQQITNAMHDLRANGGVWFLELETYRYRVHCGPEHDTNSGRPTSELEHWQARDPITLLQNHLLEEKQSSQDEINQWREEITSEIKKAFEFAKDSPFPEPSERFRHLYAESNTEWLENALTKESAEVVA